MKKKLIAFALLVLLVSASGCRVGPPLTTPTAPEYDEWTQSENPRISNSEDSLRTWAAVFEDPRLQKLTNIAIEQNYSLTAAAWRICAARAQLQIATGELFPQTQQAFGSWRSVHLSKNAPNTRFADRQFKNALLGFTVSWELDFWGRFRNGIYSADYLYQASEADYFGVQLILTADIAKTYVNLATSLELIRIIKENIRLQRRSIEIINIRLEAGVVSELDLQQAQVLLSNTESQLPIVEEAIENQKNALAVLLGATPDQIPCLLDFDDLTLPIIPPTLAIGIPANLLCRRPDLIAARELILSQTAVVGIAETNLLPSISLFGTIGYEAAAGHHLRNTNANKNLFSQNSLTFAYGPDFNWPILNYGRLEGQIKLEWARLQEMIAQYKNLVLKAYEETENALTAFIKSHEERAFLEEGLQASLRAYSLSQELYFEGLVDYERVLEAQRSLLVIQDRYAVNNGDIALSFIQIYQALGGTIYMDCE